jgi:hypothetical protein
MHMKDPLLRDIRRIRAQRSKELARDIDLALERSHARLFTWGHDVVDYSSGEPQVIFTAKKDPAPKRTVG